MHGTEGHQALTEEGTRLSGSGGGVGRVLQATHPLPSVSAGWPGAEGVVRWGKASAHQAESTGKATQTPGPSSHLHWP